MANLGSRVGQVDKSVYKSLGAATNCPSQLSICPVYDLRRSCTFKLYKDVQFCYVFM